MKNFTIYHETFENHLFTKDVSLVAYVMQKYYGYHSSIICSNTKGELTDHKTFLENIDFKVIESTEMLDEHLKNTDVLMFIGIYNSNMNMILRYKQLNPNGKVYMKLDANPTWMCAVYKNMTPELQYSLNLCDIISVESRRMQYLLFCLFGRNIEYIPNGYYDFTDSPVVNYDDKKNIILFAGRVGNFTKNNHFLLQAFSDIAHKIPDWNLEFAGSVEDNFLEHLSNCLKVHPELKSRIKLTGQLNKVDLKKKYQESKIFCLTSPAEACANVFSESVYNGCYLVSTDVDGAIDILDYGRYGQLTPVVDIPAIGVALLEACQNDDLLRRNCEKSQIYARENLSWIKICAKLNNLLN